jgi:hypothetical protein
MALVELTFTNCGSTSGDTSEGREFMIATVYFDAKVDGRSVGSFSSNLKQTQGSTLEAGDIEVELPRPADDADHGELGIPHHLFSAAAKDYLLQVFLAVWRGPDTMDIEGFRLRWATSFEVEGAGDTGW